MPVTQSSSGDPIPNIGLLPDKDVIPADGCKHPHCPDCRNSSFGTCRDCQKPSFRKDGDVCWLPVLSVNKKLSQEGQEIFYARRKFEICIDSDSIQFCNDAFSLYYMNSDFEKDMATLMGKMRAVNVHIDMVSRREYQSYQSTKGAVNYFVEWLRLARSIESLDVFVFLEIYHSDPVASFDDVVSMT